MKKIDRGICVRLCPLSDEEIAAGLTPERRLSIALARARAYARVGDPYADLIAETYTKLAERLEDSAARLGQARRGAARHGRARQGNDADRTDG